jgi:hypothetical protein
MLMDLSDFTESLGGLEFYGVSPSFRELFVICRSVSKTGEMAGSTTRKGYVFLEKHHGKTTIAKAVQREAQSNGLTANLFDGSAGPTQKSLMDLEREPNSLTILDGLPEVSASRRNVLERFNRLQGKSILFAPPEYASDVNLDERTTTLILEHVDRRPLDKLAWLIGLIREGLKDGSNRVQGPLLAELARIPVTAMVTLVGSRFGERLKRISSLGNGIADALRLRATLESEMPLPHEELTAIFMDFYDDHGAGASQGFRLWVEGETDSRLLSLVSKLAGLEGGLTILPLGLERDGGTSKVIDIVFKEQTKRNKDIFLLDCDEPGRHAKEELEVMGQEAILLDAKISCSRVEMEVEIEDFVSLSCLDRFYKEHSFLRPEREVLRYKSPPGRRLIVDGADKGDLVAWLESNATSADLENLLWVLCDIRGKFSLKHSYSMKELQTRRREIETEKNAYKQLGDRPIHWSNLISEAQTLARDRSLPPLKPAEGIF